MSKIVGKYELITTLGEGAFGKVKKGRNIETGEEVAVKVMERSRILKEGMSKQVKKEISIMKRIKHKHVVELKDVLVSKSRIYLVVELMTGGEIFYKIADEGKFSEKVARKYFQQLISGLDFCHKQGVVHRDLKPENILLDANGDLKITDFGLSANFTEKENVLKTACGTPNYVAPEVLLGKGYDGKAADIWSCGIILYVFLCGYLPIDHDNIEQLFKLIVDAKIKYPRHLSFSAKSLLKKILVKDPNKRITMEGIKQHKWFRVGLSPDEVQAEFNDGREDIFEFIKSTDIITKQEPPAESNVKIQSLNAFQIVGMSGLMSLDRMLHENPRESLFSYTRFTTSEKPRDILNAIKEIIESLPKALVHDSKDRYKLKCEIRTRGKYVLKFRVEVFKFTDSLMLVDFSKVRGNAFEYMEIYKRIKKKLSKKFSIDVQKSKRK